MAATINVNGIDVAYDVQGPADAPALMFSNSLAASYRMWDAQAEAFSGDYRVLRFDARGHGGTEATPRPYTVQLLLEDAVALLDALDIDKVHFCGLSLGGMIGQRFGALQGDRLYSLTLCDTTSQKREPDPWVPRIEMAATKGMPAMVDGTLDRWLTEGFRADHPEIVAWVGEMIAVTPIEGFIGCANAIQAMDQDDLLPQIAAPTLVMVGEHDPSTTVEAAEHIHGQVPGAKLEIIKAAAHLSNVQQPDAFNQALKAHIDRHNP